MDNSTTLVTGLWNIQRETLGGSWSRSFDTYLKKFEELLKIENNIIIYGDEELEKFVKKHRSDTNTQFILRDIEWFKNTNYYNKIQKIRTNPKWYNQTGWLNESTQAKLEMYNPLVMSKMFLLHDAKILDKFKSKYFFWIDAGLTNTVHPGYFTHDKVISKLPTLISNFTFICFPYSAETEVHGFEYKELCRLAQKNTDKVARGGFFGGPKESISEANALYYDLLNDTLDKDLMGTEESIFTLMLYKYPDIFHFSEIESDGLINKFFENVKNNNLIIKKETNYTINNKPKSFTDKSALYVITFNSPKQFETLVESMRAYDSNFLNKTTKFLLDNSSDKETFKDYSNLCNKYGFEHIKKDNLGICGGRQFIAEHFNETDLEYMYFFEDDMFFYPHKGETCKSGFNRFVDNLYNKIMKIISKESFDFIKLSFSEFYGNNSKQWSWYNVPQNKREEFWPEYSKLPENGLDPNSPSTNFTNIKIIDDIPYILGEIYYCNWPQIVSKEGNKKMFLNTKWKHPFEQTWMSHIFQETKAGNINPGLLLISPIEHNRFIHYNSNLRKES